MNRPTVSIVIPTYNGKHLLEECLPTLYEQDYPEGLIEIVIFDNASGDGTQKFLQEKYPQAKVMSSDRNLFFAPAVNRAAEEARGEILVLINNDMRAHKDFVAALVDGIEEGANCAASTIMDWQGDNYQFCGGGINVLGQGFEDGGPVETMRPEKKRLLFACGGAMAISRETFIQVGGFDEDYQLLYEDVDLGWRLNLMGYKVLLAPDAKVWHRAHSSVSKMAVLDRVRILERNALFTIIKNYHDWLYHHAISNALMLAEARAAIYTQQANEVPMKEKVLRAFQQRGRLKHKGEAIHAALGEVAGQFPTLLKKRDRIQEARKKNDLKILTLFQFPDRVWAYENEDYRVLESHGYDKLLAMLCFSFLNQEM